jgi:hypothetical protein
VQLQGRLGDAQPRFLLALGSLLELVLPALHDPILKLSGDRFGFSLDSRFQKVHHAINHFTPS